MSEALAAEVARLRDENATLLKKLEFCQAWMKKQVEEQVYDISKRKARSLASESRDDFFREQQQQLISTRIERYFGSDGIASLAPHSLEYVVNAEIAYYALLKNPSLDGLSVVGTYQKLLDELVEARITVGYRAYARDRRPWLSANDPLEKALHLVVTKDYILSLGRLYGLLKLIRETPSADMHAFTQTFAHYVTTDPDVAPFLEKPFYPLFAQLISSQAMGEKRHRGTITVEETRRMRTWVTGDFVPGTPSVLSCLMGLVPSA